MRAEKTGYRIVGELKNTDRIMADTFWIGVYPGMTDAMIDYMAETIIEAVKKKQLNERSPDVGIHIKTFQCCIHWYLHNAVLSMGRRKPNGELRS